MPAATKTFRYTAALIGLTAFCYLGLLVWPDLMASIGAGHAGVWFLDINTLLASNDAVVRGLNPYLPNPLDYTRDPHVYSDWWLQLRHFGFGRKDRLWMGALIDGFFFLVLFWRLRAGSFRETLVQWLLIWSPPFILGFNRANPDLLIYALLAPSVPALLSRDWRLRTLGCALITLAIGLKYYPVVACGLILLTARDRAELRRLVILWVVLGAALVYNLEDDIGRSSGLMTASAGFYTFGAAALAANLGHAVLIWGGGSLLALAAFAQGWRRPVFAVEQAGEQERTAFVLGAGLLVVCYFLTISYTYRLVFALLALPLLLQLTHSARPGERLYAWTVLVLSLILFWTDGLAVLFVNLNRDVIPAASIRPLLDGLIVAVHVLGWLWVLAWLLGLGGVARFIRQRWLPCQAQPAGTENKLPA
jgi:hypothetical protein